MYRDGFSSCVDHVFQGQELGKRDSSLGRMDCERLLLVLYILSNWSVAMWLSLMLIVMVTGAFVLPVGEPGYYMARLGWFASCWLWSPHVRAWSRSRRQARQVFRGFKAAMLRAPFWFVGAVVRGMVAGFRWSRRW
jgi:hypothetical protein